MLKNLNIFSTITSIIFFLVVADSFGQFPYLNHYTTKEGLPTNQFYCIFHDQKGYIWFGSEYGVTRFDGKEFKNFTTNDGLVDNTVLRIRDDNKGNIWLMSLSGKLCFKEDEKFTPYRWNDTLKKYIGSSLLNLIYNDEEGNLWFGGNSIPLSQITNKGKYITYDDTLSHVYLKQFPDGKFIAGCNKNNSTSFAIKYIDEKKSTHFFIDPVKYYSFDPNFIKLQNGNYLCALGKHVFTLNNNKLQPNPKCFPSRVISMCEDADGNIWISCFNEGIFCFPNGILSISNPMHLLKKITISVTNDFEGNMWFATLTDGVYMIPHLAYTYYASENGLPSDMVKSAGYLNDSTLLVATAEGKLAKICNSQTRIFTPQNTPANYKYVEKIRSFSDKKNHTILNINQTSYNAWLEGNKISLGQSLKGAVKTIIESKKDACFYAATNCGIVKIMQDACIKISGNTNFRAYAICQDKQGIIWAGNPEGLWKIEKNIPIFYGKKSPLFRKSILSIISLENNWLAIATNGSGIFCYNTKNEEIIQFPRHSIDFCEFPTHVIQSENSLWYSCEKGFTKITFYGYAPLKYNIWNYSSLKGISEYGINDITYYKHKLVVSTGKGVYIIDDRTLSAETFPPPINIISSFANENLLNINKPNVLEYGAYKFKIQFRGISFINPELLKYKYKLIGFDSLWSYTKTPEIQYNSLQAGQYKFVIYAINTNNISSKNPATIAFTILTPFWQTRWFILLIILSLFLLFYLIIKIRERQLRHDKTILELTVKERTSEIMQQKELLESHKRKLQSANANLTQIKKELTETLLTKDKFFSIISHDIRSPLNSLHSYTKLIEENIENYTKTDITELTKDINCSVKNLTTMLDNLLLWAKSQTGFIQINKCEINLCNIVENNLHLYDLVIKNKKIKVSNYLNNNSIVTFDENMLDTVIRNLISNAIKFTKEGGDIDIHILNLSDKKIIQINDSGIGISKVDLDNLFRLDKQHIKECSSKEKGSGLGLILCKEFIEKNGGEIWAESELDKGSSFKFSIPN